MENHFGKGVMAGLKTAVPGNALHASQYCPDYHSGFTVGYAHHLPERIGNSLCAPWVAGALARRYALDQEQFIEFFRGMDVAPRSTERFFLAGYQDGY